MRENFDKKHFTKAERIFGEILKKSHISFKSKVIVGGREIDFVLRETIAVEIGSHSQDSKKNKIILELGYSLMFIRNEELYNNRQEVEERLLMNWI